MFDNSMQYHIFKDYEISFDEKGATYGTVRKVQWVKAGEEPDESKAKIEIRKNYMQGEQEKFGKGYTFSTPEGPSELVIGMIDAGFGDTKKILKSVIKRDDFLESATNINEDEDDMNSNGEFMFDMRTLLLDESADDEEEE